MASWMSVLKGSMYLLCLAALGVFFRGPRSTIFLTDVQVQDEDNFCFCGKCFSDNDTWYMRRYNQSVEPFLSAHGHRSEKVFNWWKRLQSEKNNFTTYAETVNSLFEIFPPNPELLEPRPEKCRTCAVVGNSVNLKGSGYGPLIDLHDVIIRINFGRTKGYEEDVGNRTTHRIMYPESSTDLDDDVHLVLFPFKLKDIEWLLRVFATKFPGPRFKHMKTIKANRDLVAVLNPAFMKYVHEDWLDKKGGYPSTGFMTLILALHICGEVDVFGYGADKDGNWSHYWEILRNKAFKTGLHPGMHEYQIIQELANNRKISFYGGR